MALNLDPIQTKGGSLLEIKLPGAGGEEGTFLPCTPSQVFFLNDTRAALQACDFEMGSATLCPAILGQAVASSCSYW